MGKNFSDSISVHPHACGEHSRCCRRKFNANGSSPRLWGTLIQARCLQVMERFIPTLVGNTSGVDIAIAHDTVHPHACGEHIVTDRTAGQVSGSSPRLWGTRRRFRGGACLNRFIPTLVGNTRNKRKSVADKAVHPHACGEHALNLSKGCAFAGSSPRLWGTRRRFRGGACLNRFIPTLVGNTCQLSDSPGELSVHPHACGEHSSGRSNGMYFVGSSPRLWGTLKAQSR